MARRLKMIERNAIIGLLAKGWSHRKIARALRINRETVGRHEKAEKGHSKPAISNTGVLTEKPGRKSSCFLFQEEIEQKSLAGLSGIRIHEDLREEHGFLGSYSSIQRCLHQLGRRSPALPFRRMEVSPGKEAQVDFSSGYWVCEKDKKRKTHVFRIVLSHSRKGYSEGVLNQNTENFLRCLENAFWSFGGVPETLVLDNLKAAVLKADWFDPELNPKMVAFAKHYGITVLPCKPYMPRHKGKVESGMKYVQNHCLKGRIFPGIAAMNDSLRKWEIQVADKRVHGTTKKQVGTMFLETEKRVLGTLPETRFPVYQEGRRKVHQDGHVEVSRSYYSVPPEYLGAEVWAQWNEKLVRIYNNKLEEISIHVRVAPGKFNTNTVHIHDKKISGVEQGAEYLLHKIAKIGPEAFYWAAEMMNTRGIEGIRVLQGLTSFVSKYPVPAINRACSIAKQSQTFRLRTVKELIERDKSQNTFEWEKIHPVIRPIEEYAAFVHVNFNNPQERNAHVPIPENLFETPQPVGTSVDSRCESTRSDLQSTFSSGVPGITGAG